MLLEPRYLNQNLVLWGPIFPWKWLMNAWSHWILVRNDQKIIQCWDIENPSCVASAFTCLILKYHYLIHLGLRPILQTPIFAKFLDISQIYIFRNYKIYYFAWNCRFLLLKQELKKVYKRFILSPLKSLVIVSWKFLIKSSLH